MELQKEDNNFINNKSTRSVLRIVKSETTQDGEGVTLNRSFPNNYISEFDPFLLLDEMGPMDIKPGKQKDFLIIPIEDLKPLPIC
jgi:quercetin 2,3-dioxygenase